MEDLSSSSLNYAEKQHSSSAASFVKPTIELPLCSAYPITHQNYLQVSLYNIHDRNILKSAFSYCTIDFYPKIKPWNFPSYIQIKNQRSRSGHNYLLYLNMHLHLTDMTYNNNLIGQIIQIHPYCFVFRMRNQGILRGQNSSTA